MRKIAVLIALFTVVISTNLSAQDNKPPHFLATEAVLKSRWNGMKEEGVRGNIDKALEYFTPMVRDKYTGRVRITAD